MGPHRHLLLTVRRGALLGEPQGFGLVEQPQLPAVGLRQPLGASAEESASHQLDFFEVADGLVGLFDPFVTLGEPLGALGLELFLEDLPLLVALGLHPADQLLKFFHAFRQGLLHDGTGVYHGAQPTV